MVNFCRPGHIYKFTCEVSYIFVRFSASTIILIKDWMDISIAINANIPICDWIWEKDLICTHIQFSTLRTCNSALVWSTALKFCMRTCVSLYLHDNIMCPNTIGRLTFENTRFQGLRRFYRTSKIGILKIIRSSSSIVYYFKKQ